MKWYQQVTVTLRPDYDLLNEMNRALETSTRLLNAKEKPILKIYDMAVMVVDEQLRLAFTVELGE